MVSPAKWRQSDVYATPGSSITSGSTGMMIFSPSHFARGCQRIANYVGGGPTHVKELIDTNDQKESGLGQVEAYQRRRNDDQRRARNAGQNIVIRV
jgi:hypothetical protein